MGVGGQHDALTVYLRERPGTHCVGEWAAPGAVWTGVARFKTKLRK